MLAGENLNSEGINSETATIRLGPAIGTWAAGWVLGTFVSVSLVVALTNTDADDLTIAQLVISAVSAWVVMLLALRLASSRFGSGRPTADYAVRFQPIDLVGVPLGVLTQLVAVPVLYRPLQHWWPETFANDELEQRARDLVDGAGGWSTVVLALVVVGGAPLVEELAYRGLLQRSMAGLVGPWPALVLTALWFALIHFSPIEIPGLLLAGLVFGGCVVVTKRIGTSIVTHAAFNAAGLLLALS